MDWQDRASIDWFPYMGLSSDVHDIPAREIITGKGTAIDVPVKKRFIALSVVFKTRY